MGNKKEKNKNNHSFSIMKKGSVFFG